MSNKDKIPGTEEAWESGKLGTDEKYAKAVDGKLTCQIDEAIGLQMISIRLEKGLIDSFKMLGTFHGVGYQPLMRDALKRFAEAEMKAIVSGMVESQRKQKTEKHHLSEMVDCEEQKAA
jgi:uncharacterized protein (DUF4415 family)